jgi:hypothetical protein
MTMPVCVMPEPPVFVDWTKDQAYMRSVFLMGIVIALHEDEEWAANCNSDEDKKPFNPVLATWSSDDV